MRHRLSAAAALVLSKASVAAPVTRTLVISRPQDASKLLGLARRYDSIHVRIPVLSAVENLWLARDLQDSYVQCGCRTARWTAIATVAALVLLFAVSDVSPPNWSAEAIVAAVSVVTLLPLLAMLIRIGAARLRVTRMVKDLHALSAAAARPVTQPQGRDAADHFTAMLKTP
jgi:hypothetical protein